MLKNKQLLIEVFPIKLERSSLIESIEKNNSRLIIPNMIIQRANVPNKNRRCYPKHILDREANKLMEGLRSSGNRGIIGELDHPESNVVNLRNACIGIMDIKWRGNDQLGDVEVLNTPSGNILKEILLAGYVPGISSRGLGSVESAMYEGDDEVDEVQDDFELLTYDAVSDPSTHNAYFKEIREGRQPKDIRQRPYQKANDLMRDLICELSGVCNIC